MTESSGRVYKLVLAGEGGVGKTSLIKQFVYSHFEDKYIKTLGTNIYKKDMAMGADSEKKDTHLQVWDVLGQKTFQAIIKTAFRGTQGFIFVCDVTNKDTLDKLDVWVNYAYDFGPRASFIFLGNKSDLTEKQFGYIELKAYADRFNAPCFMTSARTGDNVEQAFHYLAHSIYREEFAPPKGEVEVRRQSVNASPAVKAEDEIITLFCKEAGGFNIAMPVVREQFHKVGVDFERPSREDLEKVIANLTRYLEFIKGQEAAHNLGRRLQRILHEKGLG